MPFKTFNSWLFDGKIDSPIPKPRKDKNGKVVVPDITKYNSPITHTYVISLFLKNGTLNMYLDKYFNNINLRYLSREEIFKFIKKCVIDFKVKKRDLMFYPRKPKNMLYNILRDKIPFLKNDDILLLCELVEQSDDKEAIYQSLGLEKTKKIKFKKQKKETKKKISLKDFLEEHFSMNIVS